MIEHKGHETCFLRETYRNWPRGYTSTMRINRSLTRTLQTKKATREFTNHLVLWVNFTTATRALLPHSQLLRRSPKRSVIHIPQHPLTIIHVRRVDRPFILHRPRSVHGSTNKAAAHKSKWGLCEKTYRDLEPDQLRQLLHLLQIQLHRRIMRIVILEMPQQRSEVDPHSTGREDAMDDAEVVYYVLRLLESFC